MTVLGVRAGAYGSTYEVTIPGSGDTITFTPDTHYYEGYHYVGKANNANLDQVWSIKSA